MSDAKTLEEIESTHVFEAGKTVAVLTYDRRLIRIEELAATINIIEKWLAGETKAVPIPQGCTLKLYRTSGSETITTDQPTIGGG